MLLYLKGPGVAESRGSVGGIVTSGREGPLKQRAFTLSCSVTFDSSGRYSALHCLQTFPVYF